MTRRIPRTDYHRPSVPPDGRFGDVETRQLADPDVWRDAWEASGRNRRLLRVETDGRVTVCGAEPSAYRAALERAGGNHRRLRVEADGRVTVMNRPADDGLAPSPFAN